MAATQVEQSCLSLLYGLHESRVGFTQWKGSCNKLLQALLSPSDLSPVPSSSSWLVKSNQLWDWVV